MRASQFKMPALYLATRATFSAIYRFIRSGLLWWLLCFSFGAVAWKCDRCRCGSAGVWCLRAGLPAALSWVFAAGWMARRSHPHLSKANLCHNHKNLAHGAESLQDMSCCRAAGATVSTWIFFFLIPIFFFFFLLPLLLLFHPHLERKNAGSCVLHFSLCSRKYIYIFFSL